MVKTIRRITARITALLVMALFFCMMCGFDSAGQKVYDDAGLLTSDQITRLEALCVNKAEASQIQPTQPKANLQCVMQMIFTWRMISDMISFTVTAH